jgi:hypothetical protein
MMGGLTIVSTWLSEAVVEEQTSVILVIFKVLFLSVGNMYMYFCVVQILNSSCWCRCFSTFLYIRHRQTICQFCCQLLTDCDFIGHKVCGT